MNSYRVRYEDEKWRVNVTFCPYVIAFGMSIMPWMKEIIIFPFPMLSIEITWDKEFNEGQKDKEQDNAN